MPTYQYACTACDHRFEAVQSFSDDALTVCPSCEGALRKVFSAVGVVFKGSGFYRTDSRAGAKSASSTVPAGTSAEKSTSGNGSSTTGGDKASASASASATPSAASTSSSASGAGSAA